MVFLLNTRRDSWEKYVFNFNDTSRAEAGSQTQLNFKKPFLSRHPGLKRKARAVNQDSSWFVQWFLRFHDQWVSRFWLIYNITQCNRDFILLSLKCFFSWRFFCLWSSQGCCILCRVYSVRGWFSRMAVWRLHSVFIWELQTQNSVGFHGWSLLTWVRNLFIFSPILY